MTPSKTKSQRHPESPPTPPIPVYNAACFGRVNKLSSHEDIGVMTNQVAAEHGPYERRGKEYASPFGELCLGMSVDTFCLMWW